MIAPMAASSNDIYEAVVALARSLAGRTDLRSLVAGVAESLRRIVAFDYVGLVLHDPRADVMHGYILTEPGNPLVTDLKLAVDQDPAGWAWKNQQALVIPDIGRETRWPEFVERCRASRISTVTLVPLTAGDHRIGALGFSMIAPYEPTAVELAFLERVASEFAVAVDAYLARQRAIQEQGGFKRSSISPMRWFQNFRPTNCFPPFRSSSRTLSITITPS